MRVVPFMPAEAGIQLLVPRWIPAFAVTSGNAGRHRYRHVF
jgi:hypothetical protein